MSTPQNSQKSQNSQNSQIPTPFPLRKFKSLDQDTVEIQFKWDSIIDDMQEDIPNPNDSISVDLTTSQLQALKTYSETNTITNIKDVLDASEYFQIEDVPKDWLTIKKREDQFRNTVGKDDLSDPYTNLVELTPSMLDEILSNKQVQPSSPNCILTSTQFKTSKDVTNLFAKICPNWLLQALGTSFKTASGTGGVFLAGGSIVQRLLHNSHPKDFDLFFYGCTPAEARTFIDSTLISNNFPYRYHNDPTVYRNKFTITKGSVQFILRLYKSPAEILHGFDIDSCRVGFDGTKVWMTESALWSWKARLNIVDFSHMSPSYEFRLSKYYLRGFSIHVPFMDLRRTKLYLIPSVLNRVKTQHLLKREYPQGLSKILFMTSTGHAVQSIGDCDYDPDWSIRKLEILGMKDTETVTNYVRNFNGKIVAVIGRADQNVGNIITVDKLEIPVKHRGLFDESEMEVPFELEFMTLNPGQQGSGSFHPIVLRDKSLWYVGELYD